MRRALWVLVLVACVDPREQPDATVAGDAAPIDTTPPPIDTASACGPSGSLDPTFGVGGIAAPIFSGAAVATSLLIDGDGKILVAGGAPDAASGVASAFALTQFLPDGTLDPAFGDSGVETQPVIDVGTYQSTAYALVLAANTEIIVVGRASITTKDDCVAMRFFRTGQPDPFGATPATFVSVSPYDSGYCRGGMGIDSNGRFVAGANVGDPGAHDSLSSVRIQTTGQADIFYNLYRPYPASSDATYAGFLAPDDSYVVAGMARDLMSGATSARVDRFKPDGTFDASFGAGGSVDLLALNGAFAVRQDPDGGLVVGGNQGANLMLARLQADGTSDETFAAFGLQTTTLPEGGRWNDLAIVSDAITRGATPASSWRILAAGATSAPAPVLARFHADGSPDPTFGTDGVALGDPGAQIAAIAIQPDGRIVAVGAHNTIDAPTDFFVARYCP
ncbi:MAG TPA: hypothetical protein VGM88_29725 [Kofleriaceae bacterium]|jgi:uncharacterized delta-60 repeat protein